MVRICSTRFQSTARKNVEGTPCTLIPPRIALLSFTPGLNLIVTPSITSPHFFFLSFFFPFPFPFFSNNRPNRDEILKSFLRYSNHSLSNQKLSGLYAFLNIFIGIGVNTCIYYRLLTRVFFSFVILKVLNQVGTKEELGKIRSARCVVEKGRAVNRGIICLRLYSSTQYPPGSETFLRSVNRD